MFVRMHACKATVLASAVNCYDCHCHYHQYWINTHPASPIHKDWLAHDTRSPPAFTKPISKSIHFPSMKSLSFHWIDQLTYTIPSIHRLELSIAYTLHRPFTYLFDPSFRTVQSVLFHRSFTLCQWGKEREFVCVCVCVCVCVKKRGCDPSWSSFALLLLFLLLLRSISRPSLKPRSKPRPKQQLLGFKLVRNPGLKLLLSLLRLLRLRPRPE